MAAATEKKQPVLNQYEAMFLFGSGAANDVDAAIKTVRGIIERHNGQIMVIKKWDERKLAYELKRNKRGVYIIAYFKAPGSAIAPIERDVNLSEDVLRVLVTGADHLTETEMNAVEPQPIAPPRSEERPWDRPYGEGRGGYGGGGDRGDRGGYDRGDRGGDRGERPPRRDQSAETPAKE